MHSLTYHKIQSDVRSAYLTLSWAESIHSSTLRTLSFASAAGKLGVIHSFCVRNLASTLTLWLTLKKTRSMCGEVIQHDRSSPWALFSDNRMWIMAWGCRAEQRSQPTLIAPDKATKRTSKNRTPRWKCRRKSTVVKNTVGLYPKQNFSSWI